LFNKPLCLVNPQNKTVRDLLALLIGNCHEEPHQTVPIWLVTISVESLDNRLKAGDGEEMIEGFGRREGVFMAGR
jgi:hypothetical protein